MNDMDIDMDLDLDLTVDTEANMIEEDAHPTAPFEQTHSPKPAVSVATINPFDGSVTASAEAIPEKVHVRGVDNLDTSSVKQFAAQYYSMDNFVRVEWVDDASVNLIYDTPEAAAEALVALTSIESIDPYQLQPLEMRPAKIFSSAKTPDEPIQLRIRQATTGDVKKKGARDASKFYLMNPDKDPRERKFKERRNPQARASGDEGDYTRHRYDDREHKRRRQDEAFDESMYDDAAVTSGNDSDRRKRVRFGRRNEKDLFGGRSTGRLRDRSTSPLREGDGRFGFGSDTDDSAIRRKIRQRSLTPPRRRSAQPTNIHVINNAGKELFIKHSRDSPLAPSPAFTKELFPTHPSSPKELFPNKKVSHHRRSFAIDESPERHSIETARPRSLADRISGGPTFGRLGSISTDNSDDLNIRGTSSVNIRGAAISHVKGTIQQRNGDFSIRGAAQFRNEATVKPVKELFPMKAGSNIGKELFAGKLQGRGGPRRAADSFF